MIRDFAPEIRLVEEARVGESILPAGTKIATVELVAPVSVGRLMAMVHDGRAKARDATPPADPR